MYDDAQQPHYVESFRCIGSDCEETCCQNWGVYVDKATYKKYRATPSLRRATAEHIEVNADAGGDNFKYARIKLNPDNRCPFLSAANLCSIQQEHGLEFLGKTCARYPRALVRFEGRMQKALYLSCPEAARLVLLSQPLLPVSETGYGDFTLENSQAAAIAPARQLRSFALRLLQDRTYPLWQRLFMLGIVCRRVQDLIAAQARPKIAHLLAQYATMIQEGSLRPHLDGIPARPGLQLDLVLQLIRLRFEIEQPHDSFAACVADLLAAIGHAPDVPLSESAARYHQAYLRCYQPFELAFPYLMENYLLNYIFRTRLPFAGVPAQMQRTVDPLASYLLLGLHYRLLHSLLIGAGARYGNGFSPAIAVRVVHSFARAVEHNVKFFEVLMTFVRSPELQQSDGLAVLLRN